MANFGEMTGEKQWLVAVGGVLLLTTALYFTLFRGMRDENAAAQTALETKVSENTQLEQYRPKLADMERQVANLKQQLEIERKIVPDDKELEQFIKMVDAEAAKAGIEIRRYTAKPVSAKDFYSEMPFELEIDGPYFSVLNFFDRLGKTERIVNVSSLLMANTKRTSDAKAKGTYQYAPGESVVATCLATTFFSHDLTPAPDAAGTKPGQPAAAGTR
jgi:type IV pilus assembly protein PilO